MAIRSKSVFSAVASLLLATSASFAQQPAPPAAAAAQAPVFEVVSVKEDKAAQGWHEGATADGYSAKGITLEFLLMGAYGIRPDYRYIGAPKWWNDNRFDIEAKVGDADVDALQKLSYRQRAAMVQQILADRFKLKAHLETRTEPIYTLVVVRQGVLTEVPPSPDGKPASMGLRPGRGARAGQMVDADFTMAYLASQLSGMMGRMVVDSTGLTGEYHGDLHWTPDNGPALSGSDPSPNELSIFTAVQEQLGLKLESTKGPVDVLVIDHVEMPSEN